MANDVYQLTILGICANQFWEMTPHFQSGVASAADPVGTADRCIAGFIDHCQPSMLDVLAEDVSVTGYKCGRVNNTGGPIVMKPITPAQGTVGGTSATSCMSQVISSRFLHSGHWKTGRMFLPGIPESELTGNTYSAAQITAVSNFISDLGSFTWMGDAFTYGIWSRKFTTFFTPTYIALAQKPGVQNRRLRPVL